MRPDDGEREIIPHDDERANRNRRHLFRFDPTINSGHLVQIVVILLGMATAYGTYQVDKAKNQFDIAQLRIDAEQSRANIKENIGDIKKDVREIQKALVELNLSLAVLNTKETKPMR